MRTSVGATGSSQDLDSLRRRVEPWYRELAGARISGAIPIAESRLNRFIDARLRSMDGPLDTASVHLRSGGEMMIRLVLRRPRFVPSVTITTRIEEQPQLPDSPFFVLRWWLPGMGPISALMGPALALFTTLPPGVVVDGDRMVVNLAQLLREHGGGDIFSCVTALRVDIHAEMLLVSFALDIPNRA